MKTSIVIDREYGSGGREIARLIAEKLNIKFYDGDLLIMAGEQYGIDIGQMKTFDEKGSGSFLHDMALLSSSLSGSRDHEKPFEVFEAQSRLMKQLALQDSCIFLGRCADVILKDTVPILHVFVYASNMQDKVERIRKIDGIEHNRIESLIRSKDAQRKNYRSFFGGSSWSDMKGYDMCINTSTVGYEGAADAIIAALHISNCV